MVLARKASKTELRFAFFPVRVSENEECFLGLAGMARLGSGWVMFMHIECS